MTDLFATPGTMLRTTLLCCSLYPSRRARSAPGLTVLAVASQHCLSCSLFYSMLRLCVFLFCITCFFMKIQYLHSFILNDYIQAVIGPMACTPAAKAAFLKHVQSKTRKSPGPGSQMTHFICLEPADSAEEAIEAHLESLHNTTKGTFTTARSASRGRHDKSSYWHFTCKYARHQQAMVCLN